MSAARPPGCPWMSFAFRKLQSTSGWVTSGRSSKPPSEVSYIPGKPAARFLLTIRLLFANNSPDGYYEKTAPGLRLHPRLRDEQRLFAIVRRHWPRTRFQLAGHGAQARHQPCEEGPVQPTLQPQSLI